MKNQKGITLIALIITIIVLVVLSSVVVYITLSENGVFQKAGQGSNEYKLAKENEDMVLNTYDSYIDGTREVNSTVSADNSEVLYSTTYWDGNLGNGPTINITKDGTVFAFCSAPRAGYSTLYLNSNTIDPKTEEYRGWWTPQSGHTQNGYINNKKLKIKN